MQEGNSVPFSRWGLQSQYGEVGSILPLEPFWCTFHKSFNFLVSVSLSTKNEIIIVPTSLGLL